MMTSFRQELLGGSGFSLIPLNDFHAILSANLRLLLSTKSVVAYARKQSRTAIFEWQVKEKGWYSYAGEYPTSWERKVKVLNLLAPAKNGSVSQIAQPKSAKRGDDSFETCFDIVPNEGGLPSIGNIVLKGSPPSTHTHSNKRSIASKPKPSAPRPSMDGLPSSRTHGIAKGRHPHHFHLPLLRGEYGVCYL